MARYNIDIAALSETRLSGETEIEEVGAGYTFFCIGHPDDQPRQAGVGFAIRTPLISRLEERPHGVSPRLMTMKLQLKHQACAVLISAYAPTMTHDDRDKAAFYDQLDSILRSVPFKDRLFLIGDFNARVGRDTGAWSNVLGSHSVGNENTNGTLLLQTCSQHALAITNTFYQLAEKYKTTWQHPRSKHWHLLDYVITRQRHRQEVHITRAMRGTGQWSDHRLVRSVVELKVRRPRRRQAVRRRRLDLTKLCDEEVCLKLRQSVSDGLQQSEQQTSCHDIEDKWTTIKEATFKAASETLGFTTSKHKDWFDEQDFEAQALLDDMHSAHLAWVNDKSNAAKKSVYTRTKQKAQSRLREMKNCWWINKAAELQVAADRHDMKSFYQGLKAVYGPRAVGSAPVKSLDGITLTDRTKILERWVEHFKSVLNQPSSFDEAVLSEIPQWPLASHLDDVPTAAEIQTAISQMANGKAPGVDGIPAEIYKECSANLLPWLADLFEAIWKEAEVPQDFKDAIIVHIYKRKGDRSCCDSHRGISLLSTAGKILARVLLNRLSDHAYQSGVIPESQCGFRAARGTMDMAFAVRQIQEKCREQHRDLYMIFIDLTKAFDSVSRHGLWLVLKKIGCPEKFVRVVQSLHDGMHGQIIDGAEMSTIFDITNGTKQGCVLAPLLFSIFFSLMLLVAFKDCDLGIPIRFRTDGSVFNLRRLQARTKTSAAIIRDLLYADDCALMAHTQEDAQHLFSRFCYAAVRFGLTVSLTKTEVMFQPANRSTAVQPVILAGETVLPVVEKFCYLGSTLSSDATLDNDISLRISKASQSFGRLSKRLWDDHGIRLETKIAVYKAAILTSLLYGSETWVLYRRHVKKLEQFHMRCLRRIAHIKWQERMPNTEVLGLCNIPGIEALLITSQLRWTGHVIRMNDSRLPKAIFYSELSHGARSRGGQMKRYKDTLKVNAKRCGITVDCLEALALDRTQWRSCCKDAVRRFEEDRVSSLEDKRAQRKAGSSQATVSYPCDICGRVCLSRIGLYAHRRTHQQQTTTFVT